MRIKEVVPQEGFFLKIIDEDNQSWLFDVNSFMDMEVAKPLWDRKEFEKVSAHGYFIEWECGVDLSADSVKAYSTPFESSSDVPFSDDRYKT